MFLFVVPGSDVLITDIGVPVGLFGHTVGDDEATGRTDLAAVQDGIGMIIGGLLVCT